mmetsp:Transcript_2626/g.8195  ORF Transcript_2626/g.8195 Transcript_2626/m.8195 type:complete len:363 (-) Transcript_2626:66-1154(-)
MRVLVSSLLVGVAGATDPWAEVRATLASWPNITNFAFTAGDASGRQFEFERGNTTMESALPVASASKFPAALAIARVIAAGDVSLDTFAHEVFDWWTRDDSDARSRVTLRSLLSFTSGFYAADAAGDVPCLGTDGYTYSSEDCAKEIYEQAPFVGEPLAFFDYNSFHLQVAGAMTAKAANLSVPTILSNFLAAVGMNRTRWLEMDLGDNPYLAAALVTCAEDYDALLRAYLTYDVVPPLLAADLERDSLAGNVQVSNSSLSLVQSIGRYASCNWYECIDQNATFPLSCADAHIHMDAGLFGYYPLVDRKNSTYFQIAMFQYAANTSDFGPTTNAINLRLAIKPLVDDALAQVAATRAVSLRA